jgi:hypothetical protein
MARIEISLEEYNALKNKVKNLEEQIVIDSKEIKKYKDNFETLFFAIEDLEGEGLFDRVFKWKNIINSLLKFKK